MIGKDVELIEYSKGVDFGNCLTHAVAAALSAGAFILMVSKVTDIRSAVSAVIYGLSLIAVYSVSAVYHGLKSGETKRKARLVDHSTIPVLIAGTATPCALLTLYDLSVSHGLFVLILAWFCAIFGIFSRLFFFEKLKAVTMAIYIVSSLLMMLSAVPLLGQIDSVAFGGFVFGNAFYLIGAIFCGLGRKKPFLHIVFHILVMIGSFSHFYIIYSYML